MSARKRAQEACIGTMHFVTSKHGGPFWRMAGGLSPESAADAASDVWTSLSRRFWQKVKVAEDGCWEWTGSRRPRLGHGQISLGGHQGRLVGAHVVAYELMVGDVPEGMEVCHTCDNGWCVCPSHLFLGTHTDNMRDAAQKGRLHSDARLAAIRRGEQNNMTKLTDQQVATIRESSATTRELATEYEVHRTTIQRIRNGSRR